MAKTLCKGVRKDGNPCQGLGQSRFDGYCIAHAPAHKAHEWRSRGGKNSSNAARADKRIPERLRGAIEKVTSGMDDVLESKLEPAALSAICRSAKVLIDLYRLADEEMDLIRGEENAVAAAQIAGGLGDPAILEAAASIAAWQNQYRIESLIVQGLASLEREEALDEDEPPALVLTAAGRQRFRYQRLTRYSQKDIDMFREVAMDTNEKGAQLPAVLIDLHEVRTALQEVLTDFAPASAPVLDPLTGQPLNHLPQAVKPATVPVAGPEQSEQIAKNLQDLLQQANDLTRETEALYEKQFGRQFDIRRELPEEESE